MVGKTIQVASSDVNVKSLSPDAFGGGGEGETTTKKNTFTPASFQTRAAPSACAESSPPDP